MDDLRNAQAYGIQAVGDCLVAHVTGSSDEDGLSRLKKEILGHLADGQFHGVLINVSAVSVLGSYGFSILLETARAVEMMGCTAVFVGFRPGVAAVLVESDLDLSGLRTAITTADAFDLIERDDGDNEEEPVADDDADDAEESEEEPGHGTLL